MRTVGSAHMNNKFITIQTEVKWQTPIIKSICKRFLQLSWKGNYKGNFCKNFYGRVFLF